LKKRKIRKSHLALKKEKSFGLKVFMVLLMLMVLSIVYIWQRVTVFTLANEIKKLNVQIVNQQKEYKYIQVEVAALSSVERIERLAKGMGFVYPSLENIEVLSEISDSTGLKRQGWIENIWTKLKGIEDHFLSLR
jgi:cell division protein FtsL